MSKRSEKKFDKMSTQKKIDWLMRQPDLLKLGFYNRMPEGPEKEAISKGVPGIAFLAEINAGNPGSTSKRVGGNVRVPEKEQWQHELMKNAGRLSQTGLEDVLNQLNQQYESPINNQMEQIFGHLKNPILQGLINPQHNNMASGSLFPDRMQQQYQQYHQQNPQQQYEQPSAFGNLLSALGTHAFQQHAVPWLNELEPEDLQQAYGQYVEPGLNRAYEGAQNIYGGLQNAGNWGQDKLNFLKTLPGEARNDISSLLSNLGGYGKNIFNRMRGQ